MFGTALITEADKVVCYLARDFIPVSLEMRPLESALLIALDREPAILRIPL
jgi:hypothetical protein